MPKHMWSLFNKNTKNLIQIGLDEDGLIWVTGFSTKKGLILHLDGLEYDEEIKKVTLTS